MYILESEFSTLDTTAHTNDDTNEVDGAESQPTRLADGLAERVGSSTQRVFQVYRHNVPLGKEHPHHPTKQLLAAEIILAFPQLPKDGDQSARDTDGGTDGSTEGSKGGTDGAGQSRNNSVPTRDDPNVRVGKGALTDGATDVMNSEKRRSLKRKLESGTGITMRSTAPSTVLDGIPSTTTTAEEVSPTIFCYLPVCSSGFSFLIHAEFALVASREAKS